MKKNVLPTECGRQAHKHLKIANYLSFSRKAGLPDLPAHPSSTYWLCLSIYESFIFKAGHVKQFMRKHQQLGVKAHGPLALGTQVPGPTVRLTGSALQKGTGTAPGRSLLALPSNLRHLFPTCLRQTSSNNLIQCSDSERGRWHLFGDAGLEGRFAVDFVLSPSFLICEMSVIRTNLSSTSQNSDKREVRMCIKWYSGTGTCLAFKKKKIPYSYRCS